MIKILRDAGLSELVDDDAQIDEVAHGLQFTEGPLWLPDGSVLFQDIKAERTHRLTPDGAVTVVRENTGAANGQTFDSQGKIVFCEQNGRRVSRMNPDGTDVTTVVEEFEGKRLNSPNDVVCRSDGLLYFTDPPYGAPPDRPLDVQGVYAMDSANTLRLLIDDFEKPNGLAFAPDEKTLYINDTARYHTRAFAVEPSGALQAGSSRIVATMDPEEKGGPDGIKVDRDGRLYIAVAMGVWVYQPDGTLLGIIALPKRPANLAWCGEDARTLVMTAVDSVYQVRLKVPGLPPVFQDRALKG